jgi:ATP-dependent Clp protease ATP-binding subunit ClpA
LIGSPPGYVGHAEGGQLSDAIRKHLRPELVNRLTKIVPFKPLGMDTAREILGKLIAELNGRLEERGVTVELDASAEGLILQEGYSEEYGARNLERAVDRMLGTLISGKLLSGEISSGTALRIEAVAGEIRVGV